jgi:transcriptional regulator with XRE-family HTH domain
MSPRKLDQPAPPRVVAALNRVAVALGREVFDARTARRWTLADLAGRAGVSVATAQRMEAGRSGSLEAYVRVGLALGVEPDFSLRASRASATRDADPVHAAMGEIEARHLREMGHDIYLDEPYQHYQFAGRADVVAVDLERRALLHLENRTRFPDTQAFAGSWNAKRAYLADQLARRFGIRGGFLSEDHVVVALWSAEVIHPLRMRGASFRALCPDDAAHFGAWWDGQSGPTPGKRSSLVIFDPLPGRRASRRRWVGFEAVATADPRYRGYADALSALRQAGLA